MARPDNHLQLQLHAALINRLERTESRSRRKVSAANPIKIPALLSIAESCHTDPSAHAHGILACDFFVAVTASFRLLYVFVVIEHGSRRLLHLNVTRYPSAAWTLQQLREVAGLESRHRFLLHDRDSIFSAELDASIRVQHYNRGRPHMALGPGIPDPPLTRIARPTSRHRRRESYVVRADPYIAVILVSNSRGAGG
jgi:putative transposase